MLGTPPSSRLLQQMVDHLVLVQAVIEGPQTIVVNTQERFEVVVVVNIRVLVVRAGQPVASSPVHEGIAVRYTVVFVAVGLC